MSGSTQSPAHLTIPLPQAPPLLPLPPPEEPPPEDAVALVEEPVVELEPPLPDDAVADEAADVPGPDELDEEVDVEPAEDWGPLLPTSPLLEPAAVRQNPS